MSDFSPQVDDLILFFRDGAQVEKRWVPHEVYSNKALQIAPGTLETLIPGWGGTVFSELPAAGGAYYFANLSLLLDPGTTEILDVKLPKDVADYKKATPGAGDLVLVPHDDNQHAYLVSRDLYLACPPMLDAEAYDPISLVTEGVVLANMPKVDLSGYTCYLLNLLSLRTGALSAGDHNSGHAARVSKVLASSKK